MVQVVVPSMLAAQAEGRKRFERRGGDRRGRAARAAGRRPPLQRARRAESASECVRRRDGRSRAGRPGAPAGRGRPARSGSWRWSPAGSARAAPANDTHASGGITHRAGARCSDAAQSAHGSIGCSPTRRQGRARSWCCAAQPGQGRPRSWTTPPKPPRAAGSSARSGWNRRWSSPSPGLHQLCGRCWTASSGCRSPQRDALGTAFGLSLGHPARPLPDQPRGAQPAVRGGRRPAAPVPDRRRPVARSLLRAGARLRRAAAAGGVGRRSCSRSASRSSPTSSPGCRSCGSTGCRTRTRASCSPRSSARRWTSACAAGSSPRRAATRSRCSSCRAGCRPRSWRAASACPAELPLQSRIEASFRRRVEQLPDATQRLLLLGRGRADRRAGAAVARGGGARAHHRCGRCRAVGDGLLELGARVTFRHPLLRSAIYRARRPRTGEPRTARWPRPPMPRPIPTGGPGTAPQAALGARRGRRRRAGALGRAGAGARRRGGRRRVPRARRRAHARPRQASAARARSRRSQAARRGARGGVDAPVGGGRRAARRARPRHAPAAPRTDRSRPADAPETRCRCSSTRPGGSKSLDPGLARETYLEALRAASVAGRLGGGMLGRREGRSQRAAARPGSRRATSTSCSTAWPSASRMAMPQARRRSSGHWSPCATRGVVRGRTCAGRGSLAESRRTCSTTTPGTRSPRATSRSPARPGALAVLPLALNLLALLRCFEGELVAAAALLDEADEIADATGTAADRLRQGPARRVPGRRGRRRWSCSRRATAAATARSEGVVLTFGEHARSSAPQRPRPARSRARAGPERERPRRADGLGVVAARARRGGRRCGRIRARHCGGGATCRTYAGGGNRCWRSASRHARAPS